MLRWWWMNISEIKQSYFYSEIALLRFRPARVKQCDAVVYVYYTRYWSVVTCVFCFLFTLYIQTTAQLSLSLSIVLYIYGRFYCSSLRECATKRLICCCVKTNHQTSPPPFIRSHRQTKYSRNSRTFYRWAAVVDVCMTEATELIRFQSVVHFIFRYPSPLIIFPVRVSIFLIFIFYFSSEIGVSNLV